MYRSQRVTGNSQSFEDENESLRDFSSENKENVSSIIVSNNAVNGDSITEIFQKLTLKDRNSNVETKNYNDHKNFMTSSPIPNRRKSEKGFIKCEMISPMANKVEIKEINPEPLQRASTVRNSRKPPSNHDKKPFEADDMAIKVLKKNTSTYQSNMSMMTQKVTVPLPFSFESKDKVMLENRQKLLENNLLEKKRLASAFRANPVPVSSPQNAYKTTKLTEDRLALLQEKNKLDSTMASNTSGNVNRTKDLGYMYRSPFKPTRACVDLTCPETPQFSLKSRLERWKELESVRKEQEAEILKTKKEFEEEYLVKEAAELKQLRKAKVIRANSIRQFKNIEIIHNPKTTVPLTPKFSDRFKK